MIWGQIIIYHRHTLRWIDELLRRSEPSLLDVGSRVQHISIPNGELEVLELLLNHTSRIRVFSLQVTLSCWELICDRFLRQPAPNLEHMDICILSNAGRVFKDVLFNDHAPGLRHLHLRRCVVDLASPILKSLRGLYVQEITPLDAAPTVTNWLKILGEMPSLQQITIIDAISSANSDEIIFPTIHLTKLEMLHIDGVLHESVTLINQLIAPPRCGLILILDCHARFGEDQRILWSIIKRELTFWEKDTPARHFTAKQRRNSCEFGNLPVWGAAAEEAVHHKHNILPDPVLIVVLRSPNYEDITPLFLSLFAVFQPTFVTTTYMKLWIDS